MKIYAVIFALLAMLFFGMAPLLDKLAVREISPLAGVTFRALVATVIFVVVALATGVAQEIPQASPRTLVYLAGSAVLAAVLAQFAVYVALKHADASQVTPVAMSFPLVTLVGAFVVLGEKITWQRGLGALLIVVGVVLITAFGQRT